MGLRELNAERTTELILDAAITLFTEQGYEESTLEQIAERAEVSLSTLYRYFPTKDQLVLTPVAFHGQTADALAKRPLDEPMDLALGHAVLALLATPRGNPQRLKQVSKLIATSPSLRSRLRDEFVRERLTLQHAIAARLGRPDDDVYSGMTARIAMDVFELASLQAHTLDDDAFGDEAFAEAAQRVMSALLADPPAIPRLP